MTREVELKQDSNKQWPKYCNKVPNDKLISLKILLVN